MTRNWDSIARAYVEYDTAVMETFGEMPANDNVPVAHQQARTTTAEERLLDGLSEDVRKGKLTPNNARFIADLSIPIIQEGRENFNAMMDSVGFMGGLTNDQLKAALAYGGPVNHGDPAFATRTTEWIQTFLGGQFWPMEPRAEDVHIEDIAHALSMECRYNGHCIRFYSVAEHSVHLAEYLYALGLPASTCLWALLHDAPEAYIRDIARPVKPYLVGYSEAEARLMSVIAERFGLPAEMPAIVKEVDSRIIGDERVNMAPCVAEWEDTGHALGIKIECWKPDEAKRRFLNFYRVLSGMSEGRAA
ncbi:hypothetical protein [Limoniibacter endophyticus]|uniref:HD domain-containing protein n=1 Tax=Limoniibacter endophyticus TaxID=1565040 RepID=A0A8J3DDZ1_9HYPH|nr:hypothetical protein [Limoniibacter endophyticus]GHC61743.1 hypothetical protein GCM10010136_02480 [Limoniibacter endophyticus]